MTWERQSVSFRRLAWLAALLAAVAMAGAYVAYLELLHYRRRAAEHLPPNTVFAARLDVEQVLLFDPVRRHLLPLVELVPPATVRAERPDEQAHTRLARLRAAGLNLGLDLREIVVATTADDGWLIALGGLFPDRGALAAIEHVLHEENAQGWQRVDSRLELSSSGAVVAQAQDGTLLLADRHHTLAAALPVSTRHLELGLAREGAGGAAMDLTGQEASTWTYPGPPSWLGSRRATASLRLDRDVELELRIEAGDARRAQALAREANQWAAAKTPDIGGLPPGGSDPVGLWARTKAVKADRTSLNLVSYWRPSELDRCARELAAWVRRRLPPGERAGS